jgi:hypothetical protein
MEKSGPIYLINLSKITRLVLKQILYCPVLKASINELKATALLSKAVANFVKPIYEFPQFKEGVDSETKIVKFGRELRKLGMDRPCYIDFRTLKPGAKNIAGESLLAVAFQHFKNLGLRFEPAFGLGRDDALWPLVIEQAKKSGGLIIRLEPEDLLVPTSTIDQISNLQDLGLDFAQVDLMCDWRTVRDRNDSSRAAEGTFRFFELFANRFPLRSIIIGGSCAPKNLSEVAGNSTKAIERFELELFSAIGFNLFGNKAIFSDYCVVHPDYTVPDKPFKIPPKFWSPKLQYTSGKFINIFKGIQFGKEPARSQYQALALKVVSQPYFKGEDYSFADQTIFNNSLGKIQKNLPGFWIQVDLNHHIRYTVAQLREAQAHEETATGDEMLALMAGI